MLCRLLCLGLGLGSSVTSRRLTSKALLSGCLGMESPGFTSLWPGFGTGHMFESLSFAVGRWFPPDPPVSSTSETDISSSTFHYLDMTMAVAEALSPNKPNQTLP